jgi:hypothetical protein
MPEKEYQRLTRARPRSGFAVVYAPRSSLWLGKDHLLCVDSTGYAETYKRFYFRDIQAITIRRTEGCKIRLNVYGGLTVLLGILAAVYRQAITTWLFGLPAALFALLFAINLFAGPTSACRLQTAVQTEELPSLNRLRRARKVLERLRTPITAVQGRLAPEDIPARVRELIQPEAPPETNFAEPAPIPFPAQGAADDPNAPRRSAP